MKKTLFLLLLCGLSFCPLPAMAVNEFFALCYHNTMDRVNDPDGLTISTDKLVQHFSWLKSHGYQAVSVEDLLAAQKGLRPLPEKAFLLTFDDGYRGFYERVFPLLKAYEFPAVLALVGSWMEGADTDYVNYGHRFVPRNWFISWDEAREMANSGLVEIASHSYDFHHGIIGNPQRNPQPALSHRSYDAKTGEYEKDGPFIERIREDLSRNCDLIEKRLGKRPRVMVWPFGEYNLPSVKVANQLGMPVALGLTGGMNNTGDLSQLRRNLVPKDMELSDLVWQLRNFGKKGPFRVVQVDLDYVYDPDPVQQEKNLGLLIDRIAALKISAVFLQAFADPDGNGTADALYFPNRHLPVRADLFNRAAWQLRSRAKVQVFAWMPVLGFELGNNDLLVRLAKNAKSSQKKPQGQVYKRLSPFDPQARKIIGEIYEDLGRYANFRGLLFHDDAFLTDFEDNHYLAKKTYREQWGLSASIEEIHNSPELMVRWTEAKTRFLIDWTRELADRVRIWRPEILTARNLYARPVLDPDSEAWFAQSLPLFLQAYDWTAVMAMPHMENAKNPQAWMEKLVMRIKDHPQGLRKTIFELQSFDWEHNRPVPTEEIVEQMKFLQRQRAVNFGYYPDNFHENQPDLKKIRGGISLQSFPYRP